MFEVQCSRLGVIGLRFEVRGWRFEVRDLGCGVRCLGFEGFAVRGSRFLGLLGFMV
jgi:hypothetical protein